MEFLGIKIDDKHFQDDRIKPAFIAFIISGFATFAAKRAILTYGLELNLRAQLGTLMITLIFFIITIYLAILTFKDDKKTKRHKK